MGGNRRRKKGKKDTGDRSDNGNKTKGQINNDGVIVHLEPNDGTTHGIKSVDTIPPAWSIEFVQSIEKKTPKRSTSSSSSNNVMDVGLQMVRGTLERISSRNHKKSNKKKKKNTDSNDVEKNDGGTTLSVKPTPIQLRLWPALLTSFESKEASSTDDEESSTASALNVVGIAPTGTGKTMAYCIPIISHCVRTLLCQQPSHSSKSKKSTTNVHGLVLVPTRELALQVSKEFKVAAKVANKYLSKCSSSSADDDDGDGEANATTKKVESMAVYGGVDIETQIASLLGKGEESSSSSSSSDQRSLVVTATAGRLLDILKKQQQSSDSNNNEQGELSIASSAFANLQAIVFDEADRIAVNADMAGQVDEILSILKSVRGNNGDVVSCLVSATLPDKAQEMCEKWVPKSRIVVKVDSVKVGQKQRTDPLLLGATTKAGKDGDGEDNESPSAKEPSQKMPDDDDDDDDDKKKNLPQNNNLDMSSIPSNIVQTLHVCSNHKKPKKLILTLSRIYLNKAPASAQNGGGRFSVNNRLCIVFFAQIKTVKYVSKLLVKEGLRCVELYGSLNQTERERRLLEFKAGKRPILLATDVAARGLHINNVHFVVNYDFPSSLDQYVHRCGRAGRKQALSGEVSQYHPPTVYSFYPREFTAMAGSVVELLNACNAWVDPNLLALTKENKKSSSAKSSKKNDSGRKRKRNNDLAKTDENKSGKDDDVESDNDQFSFLGRSVLKRASHVSDAEDSDGDESS